MLCHCVRLCQAETTTANETDEPQRGANVADKAINTSEKTNNITCSSSDTPTPAAPEPEPVLENNDTNRSSPTQPEQPMSTDENLTEQVKAHHPTATPTKPDDQTTSHESNAQSVQPVVLQEPLEEPPELEPMNAHDVGLRSSTATEEDAADISNNKHDEAASTTHIQTTSEATTSIQQLHEEQSPVHTEEPIPNQQVQQDISLAHQPTQHTQQPQQQPSEAHTFDDDILNHIAALGLLVYIYLITFSCVLVVFFCNDCIY